jgi:hypothetical protein
VNKIEKSFIKTKIQFIKLSDFFGIRQHTYKSFSTKILDQHDIKVQEMFSWVVPLKTTLPNS